MDFYDKHSVIHMDVIQSINPIKEKPNQPEFINMAVVNGQEVAFLGDKSMEDNYDQLRYKFMRVDRMTIPEGASLVNIDVLMEQLPEPNNLFPENDKAIDTDVEDFFHKGKLKQNVILKVCGMVSEQHHLNMNIHQCENLRK